jgi:hypothetical protein
MVADLNMDLLGVPFKRRAHGVGGPRRESNVAEPFQFGGVA